MSMEQPIGFGVDEGWFAGEDKTFRFYVGTGEVVETRETAQKDATQILVKPLKEALISGAKVRFNAGGDGGAGVLATLSSAAAVGDMTLAVTALPGAVQATHKGYRVDNVNGFALAWTVREGAYESAPVLITKSGASVIIVDGPEGVVDVVTVDDDTVDGTGALLLPPGTYQHALKRTDGGAETVLAYGPAKLQLSAAR